MSRDIGPARSGSGDVTCSRCGSHGHHWPALGHAGSCRVWLLPPSSAPAARPLPCRRAGGRRTTVAPTRVELSRDPDSIRERIVELRLQLIKDGFDAGPVTIAWHLEQAGVRAPSTSTIRRILHAAGLVTPEPRKRPRSSYHRFVAAQPNECWQSDFTHWRLTDGTDVEILNFLDDHSRYLLACTAHTPVTGELVVDNCLAAADEHGLPASTLTDNGRVYTARFGGGRNAFEYLLAVLGVTQKNGHPGHPQTQGKIERFHQTLKRWLGQQPPAATLHDLQTQLDRFRDLYNHQRPHRELGRRTPASAYTALPKAAPPGHGQPGHYRLRYDVLDPRQDELPTRRPHAPPRHRRCPLRQTRPRHRRQVTCPRFPGHRF
jgi:transposase InsO family protein